MTECSTLTGARSSGLLIEQVKKINGSSNGVYTLEELQTPKLNLIEALIDLAENAEKKISGFLKVNDYENIDRCALQVTQACLKLKNSNASSISNQQSHLLSLFKIHFSIYSFEVRFSTGLAAIPGYPLIELVDEAANLNYSLHFNVGKLHIDTFETQRKLVAALEKSAAFHRLEDEHKNTTLEVHYLNHALKIQQRREGQYSLEITKNKLRIVNALENPDSSSIAFHYAPQEYRAGSNSATADKIKESLPKGPEYAAFELALKVDDLTWLTGKHLRNKNHAASKQTIHAAFNSVPR